MAPAVELIVLVEVDEVDQKLRAHVAGQAGRVPGPRRSSPAGRHTDVAAEHTLPALKIYIQFRRKDFRFN